MPKEVVPLSESRYHGTDLLLAAAIVDSSGEKPEIDPSWFCLLFIGGEDMRKLGEKLITMADREEMMLYVQPPAMPRGSV